MEARSAASWSERKAVLGGKRRFKVVTLCHFAFFSFFVLSVPSSLQGCRTYVYFLPNYLDPRFSNSTPRTFWKDLFGPLGRTLCSDFLTPPGLEKSCSTASRPGFLSTGVDGRGATTRFRPGFCRPRASVLLLRFFRSPAWSFEHRLFQTPGGEKIDADGSTPGGEKIGAQSST